MSRLNAGAFEFVPGQVFRAAQGQQQQNPQNPQQPGQHPPHPQPGYGGPPPFQQQGYPQYYGQQQYQQQPYYPQNFQQPPYQHPHAQYAPPIPYQQPHRPQEAPRPPPQADRPPAEAPKPVSISLNIGGAKPAADAARPAGNAAADSSSANTQPAAQAQKPAPKAQSSVPKPESATPKTAKPATKAKDAVFSLERAKNDADTIIQEQATVADEDTIQELYGKDEEEVIDPNVKLHLNVIFTGHVDAGKSTLGGQILVLCGMVDKRTLEKWEKESKEAGRETWYLSWALDSTQQERDKGKTVEVGRGYFETDKKRYTMLDAPGHNTFVPSMITGAAQADVSVLVISARKGEFETGFEKGGQTREHITLVRTAGVNKIVVVVNKMDDPTVLWSKERFDEIKDKITPFARGSGYNPKTDLTFIPVSAYTGVNIKERLSKSDCPWWEGPSLLEFLDNMEPPNRKLNGPVMLPVAEKYKDMGAVVVGKLESGRIRKGDALLMMPNQVSVEVSAMFNEMEDEIENAFSGDNVRLRLRGVDDEEISPGYVLTSPNKPVHAVRNFIAQLAILDSKNIICAGYSAVLHVHTLSEEIVLAELLHYLDKKTGRRSKKPPQFAKKGMQVIVRIETAAAVCVEPYKEHAQLGRFTLRDEGKTVAMGKVLKLLDSSADVSVDSVTRVAAGLAINK